MLSRSGERVLRNDGDSDGEAEAEAEKAAGLLILDSVPCSFVDEGDLFNVDTT